MKLVVEFCMLGVGVCETCETMIRLFILYSYTSSREKKQRTLSSRYPREMNVEKLQASEQRPTSKQRRVVSRGCRSEGG